MRVAEISVQGFRSLRSVELKGLGPFNVFYGPNGAGKSNVLAAINLTVEVFRWAAAQDFLRVESFDGTQLRTANLIRREDVTFGSSSPRTSIALQLAWEEPERVGALSISELTIELGIDWTVREHPRVSVGAVAEGRHRLIPPTMEVGRALGMEGSPTDVIATLSGAVRTMFLDRLPRWVVMADADRFPRPETNAGGAIENQLRAGHLKSALLAAKNHPDRAVRSNLETLKRVLTEPPLERPPFDVVEDPASRRVEVVESWEAGGEAHDLPIELAGLGIAQLYYTLARILLPGGRVISIEEPEAHLHAPTSGLQLRHVLERLVATGVVDQVFVATHSNLFDLDPGGYFDVSLDEAGGTVIERLPLEEIDKRHLYEPGPAKHALVKLLSYAPPDETVFRRPDGTPVAAAQMLEMLQRDDELAVSFLQDVHSASVRMVRGMARKHGS